jgi:mono/diheme cytochrome c family protein
MRVFIVIAALLAAALPACAQSRPSSPDALVTRGQAVFKNQGCYGCHTVEKFGTPIGPDLSTVGRKYPPDYLARWLKDPALQRPNAHMPALELTETEIRDLAAYLGSLR